MSVIEKKDNELWNTILIMNNSKSCKDSITHSRLTKGQQEIYTPKRSFQFRRSQSGQGASQTVTGDLYFCCWMGCPQSLNLCNKYLFYQIKAIIETSVDSASRASRIYCLSKRKIYNPVGYIDTTTKAHNNNILIGIVPCKTLDTSNLV